MASARASPGASRCSFGPFRPSCPLPHTPQGSLYTRIAMSNSTPSLEANAGHDAAWKELLHALAKNRALDKHLASSFSLTSSPFSDDAGLLHAVHIHNIKASYLTEPAAYSGATSCMASMGISRTSPVEGGVTRSASGIVYFP